MPKNSPTNHFGNCLIPLGGNIGDAMGRHRFARAKMFEVIGNGGKPGKGGGDRRAQTLAHRGAEDSGAASARRLIVSCASVTVPRKSCETSVRGIVAHEIGHRDSPRQLRRLVGASF